MAGDSEVIELRIHGVGGATPEELLGVTSRSDTIRVAGDELAGFYARRSERRVEGYIWGRLNAGFEQPLWIFLLPFTLVNVAGWFAPAVPSARRRLEQVGDLVLYAFGLSMTALLALWIAAISIDQIAVRWIFARTADPVSRFTWLVDAWPYIILGFGVVLTGAIVAGIVLLARASFARYEGAGPQSETAPSLSGARIREQSRGLHDPRFWSSVADVRRLFGWHAATMLAVMLLVGTFGIYRIGFFKELGLKGPAITEDLPWLFTIVTGAQLTLLLLLLVLRLFAWWRVPSRRLRILGPPVLCGMAFLVSNTLMFSIGSLVFDRLHVGRAPVSLGVPIGVLTVVGAILLAYQARRVWRLSSDEKRDVAGFTEQAEPGREIAAVTQPLRRKAIRQEHLARAVPTLGGPFTLLISLFVVAMGTGVVLSLVLRDGERLPRSMPLWVAQMAQRAGGIILVLAATSLLALIMRGFRQPSDRRPLAVMWDVLSFWPRRYHPLAVRPYSERAIPDIESRVKWHAGRGRRVIVAAHSQGSVLAYATLLRLAVSDPDILPSVALVTYGSPLKNLYARFFPRYFSVEDFEGLRQRTGSTPGGEHAWRNFYRSTDYVGWTVFTDALASSDRRLPDPPNSPLIEAVPLGRPLPAGTDPPPPPFTKLSIHSGYTSEPEIRAWIDAQLVARLMGVVPDERAGD